MNGWNVCDYDGTCNSDGGLGKAGGADNEPQGHSSCGSQFEGGSSAVMINVFWIAQGRFEFVIFMFELVTKTKFPILPNVFNKHLKINVYIPKISWRERRPYRTYKNVFDG